ncbi:MAG: PEP-CTERM sorting domain-containing protein [Burkholderiales bacterium]
MATAETFDPWIFTPDEDTLVTLDITLEDVNMMAQSEDSDLISAAAIEAFGAFGMGGVPGENVLGSWDFFKEIVNSSFAASTMSLFHLEDFLLEEGTQYWLTADLETAATVGLVTIPEPSSFGLLAIGMVSMAGCCRWWRRKSMPKVPKSAGLKPATLCISLP